MTSSFAEGSRNTRRGTIRYLDGSIGPELLSCDVIVVYLIAISQEYSTSNSHIFNRLNRALLKILFLSDPEAEVTVSYVWSRFVRELKGRHYPLDNPDDILVPIEKQLVKLSQGEVADLMEFFGEVEHLIFQHSHTTFPIAPVIAPESIFGLFLRRSVLQFRNLKFSQLTRLYNQYKKEIKDAFRPKDVHMQSDLFDAPSPLPPGPGLLDSGYFYDGVREIYSQGLVESKVNLLELSPQDDPPTLHTTADICQTSLAMAHLYHRYGLNRLALRFLKEGITLAHELRLREVSRISSDWLKIYLKLSKHPEGDRQDGNFLLDSMLATKIHKCEAEWKNGQSKAVTWTSELPKATTMKCLYWDKVGKTDMCGLSSQLSLSTLGGEGGEWSQLLGHEMARGCNAMIFIAKMLCTRGEYRGALSLLDKLGGICIQNTWLYAQTSEAMLDIQTEKCLLAGDLKEAERLITLLFPFNFILARLKEVELSLVRNKPGEAYAMLARLSDTKRMKSYVHMRYLLDLSQALLLTNSPALSLTPLSQCIALSQAAKAMHYHSSALVLLSHCYLLIDKPEFATRLLQAKLLQITECGSVLLSGSAHLNLAQALIMKEKKGLFRVEVCDEIVNLLKHSLTDFTKCGAVRKQMDVLQLLYQVYGQLGNSFLDEKERTAEQFAILHHTQERFNS